MAAGWRTSSCPSSRHHRRAGLVCLAFAIAVALPSAALGLAPSRAGAVLGSAPLPNHAVSTAANAVPATFSADVDAVAVRVEVDEPLPAGSGDIPSVRGEVNAQFDTAELTSAADLLGAVTGPKVVDPTGKGNHYADDPQATCQYPSGPLKAVQSYPLNGSGRPTIQSEATCGAGPSAAGTAYSAGIQAGLLQVGVNSAHDTVGPDPSLGAVVANAQASASDVSLPGLFHVAQVESTGSSRSSGRPGGAATKAEVTVSDLTIAGQSLSLGRGGVSVGTAAAVPVASAQPTIDQFNQTVAPSGCVVTLLSNPTTFPQGPLFARPPLPDRVDPGGADAGSTAAGLIVRCVVPDALNPTNFKPLIVQVLLGFVGTETHVINQTPFSIPLPASTGLLSSGPGPAPAQTGAPASATGAASALPVVTPPIESHPALAGPTSSPPAASPSPAPVSPKVQLAVLSAPLRMGLEIGGTLLAMALACAGMVLIGPWRVTPAWLEEPEG